jgi:hypothetical protein
VVDEGRGVLELRPGPGWGCDLGVRGGEGGGSRIVAGQEGWVRAPTV